MSAPSPAHLLREKDKLYVTDAELIRRLGVPEKTAREAIRMLDRDPRSGFPRKQPFWGNRRYLPAVLAYLDARNGMLPSDAARSAAENRDRSRLPRHSPERRPIAERQPHD